MGPSEYLGAGLISATVTCDQGQEFQEDTVRDGVSAQTQEQSHHSEPREGLALACLGGNKLPGFQEGPGHRFIPADQSLEIFSERSD